MKCPVDMEKAMATHSSTLAWKIPWMEEPGGLQSMGSLRVGHDWATSLSLFTFMHWRRKWQPLQCSCLENPRNGGAWWAAIYGVAQSWTRLKRLSGNTPIRTTKTTAILKHQYRWLKWQNLTKWHLDGNSDQQKLSFLVRWMTATLEVNMVVSYKAKHSLTMWSKNHIPRYLFTQLIWKCMSTQKNCMQ